MRTARSSSQEQALPPGARPPPGPGTPQDQAPPRPGTPLPRPGTPPGPGTPSCGQTHTCKHITLPQTMFAGGNNAHQENLSLLFSHTVNWPLPFYINVYNKNKGYFRHCWIIY